MFEFVGIKEILPFGEIEKDTDFQEYAIDCFFDIYETTGNFSAIIAAYHYHRKFNRPLPEKLLILLDKHFDDFLNSKEKSEGLAALGFDSNKKGGAWQLIAFKNSVRDYSALVSLYIFDWLATCPTTGKKPSLSCLFDVISGFSKTISAINMKRIYHESIKK